VRLYSRMNAGAVDDPLYGHFEVDEAHGGFDLPDELSDQLHSVHVRKKPAWETEDERNERLHGEESARRRDPETLYTAVAEIAGIAKDLAAMRAQPVPAAPAVPAAKSAAGAKADSTK
jgi:hypothetical protein